MRTKLALAVIFLDISLLMKLVLHTFLASLLCLHGFSQNFTIDGLLDDWQEGSSIYDDRGDSNNGVDIGELYLSHNDDYLFIGFDVSEEMIIQFESNFQILIDADNDASTGFPTNGLGTEFSFYFEGNNGFINTSDDNFNIKHDDVGFYVAPAYTSKYFEIAIERSLGDYGISLDSKISIAIVNDIFNGDILPSLNGGVEYDFNDGIVQESPEPTIEKADNVKFRILSYNVLQDQIFQNGLFDEYQRIFEATQPDIIAFQEIYDNSSTQAKNLVESFLPSDPGENWYHDKVGSDIILVSRHPILFEDWVDGNGAFVLDIDGQEVVLFNVHFPCCDNDAQREDEIDALLAYMRDLQNGNGEYDLDEDTPMIIVGDYNLVGRGSQLESLLTGNIKNNPAYGPDFSPDWGNGPLTDLRPLVNNTNLSYTWYNPFGSFTAGRLDFVLYTSSSLYLNNSFVLDTRQLNQGQLFLNNLGETDTGDASDHLPVISDWNFEIPLAPLVVNVDVNHIDCYGFNNGSIILEASGGTSPYSYQLGNGDIQSDPVFDNLAPNTYLVKVLDSDGQSFESFVTINENPEIIVEVLEMENSVELIITGGVAPYQCSINGGMPFSDDKIIENLENGSYELLVTDALGCEQVVLFDVIMNQTIEIESESINIHPNPTEDNVSIISDEIINEIIIYNLTGQKVVHIVGVQNELHLVNLHDIYCGQYLIRLNLKNGQSIYKRLFKH